MLLKAGANPHATNSRKETPLDRALSYRKNYTKNKLLVRSMQIYRQLKTLGELDQELISQLKEEQRQLIQWRLNPETADILTSEDHKRISELDQSIELLKQAMQK